MRAVKQAEATGKPLKLHSVEGLAAADRMMRVVGARLDGNDYTLLRFRREIFAMIGFHGPPHIWMTIAPSDIYSPLIVYLTDHADEDSAKPCKICIDGLIDPNQMHPFRERIQLIAADPVAGAVFFDLMVTAFLDCLVGLRQDLVPKEERRGLFGVIQTYVAIVECQGRGAQHLHGAYWLRYGMSYGELQAKLANPNKEEKDKFGAALIDYLDDIIWQIRQPSLLCKRKPSQFAEKKAQEEAEKLKEDFAKKSKETADSSSASPASFVASSLGLSPADNKEEKKADYAESVSIPAVPSFASSNLSLSPDGDTEMQDASLARPDSSSEAAKMDVSDDRLEEEQEELSLQPPRPKRPRRKAAQLADDARIAQDAALMRPEELDDFFGESKRSVSAHSQPKRRLKRMSESQPADSDAKSNEPNSDKQHSDARSKLPNFFVKEPEKPQLWDFKKYRADSDIQAEYEALVRFNYDCLVSYLSRCRKRHALGM